MSRSNTRRLVILTDAQVYELHRVAAAGQSTLGHVGALSAAAEALAHSVEITPGDAGAVVRTLEASGLATKTADRARRVARAVDGLVRGESPHVGIPQPTVDEPA